jgi:hypothetical protein
MAQETIKLAPPEDPETGVRTGNDMRFSWFEAEDLEYTLKMDHVFNDGDFLEEVSLSREEYLALKALVAKMRGIKPEEKAA